MPRSVKLNEQMRLESRARILSTARALFSRQGFFNVRIADIARQADMSPGNIYWYFPSKEDILKAILEDFFKAFEGMLIQAETYPGNALEKIKNLIGLQIAILDTFGEHTNIYMSILGHGGPALMKSLGFDTVAIGRRFHQHLNNLFESAIREGIIYAQPPDALTIFYFSFFNGLLSTYGADWKLVPSDLITEAILRLLGVQKELRQG